jgi:peptidoglycan hydrolase-like protein with peptidoglycan-binding domain
VSKNRKVVLVAVVGWVAGVAAGGWVAGAGIESPADAAARTAAPSPSPILVPIVQRVLRSNVVTRGTAGFGLPQPISIAPSPLKGTAAGVITTLPRRNAQFKEGEVLFIASGRPVFVLQGEIPAYRDLGPGAQGSDVRQLEQCLKRLGFDPGPVDDIFDSGTSKAVEEWYRSAGFNAFGSTPEQMATIRTLEAGREDAARTNMSAASAAAGADLALEAARLKAQQAVKGATADLEIAASERAASVVRSGQATSRPAADAKIEAARAGLRAALAEGEAMIRAAVEAKKLAEFDGQVATSRLERAETELATALNRVGVQLPVDEIVFLPRLPVRVQEIQASVGSAATGPVFSVTDNQLMIGSSLPLQAAPLVKPGMEVHIDEPAYGVKTKGVVDLVEQTPGTHGVDGYHIYLAVRVHDTSLRLDGFSLRLTIPVVSTKGMVLAVPISALSLGADGASRVSFEEEGRLNSVIVEPGMAADGYVEISSSDETLKPGRLVVVGHESFNQGSKAIEMQEPKFALSGLLDAAKNAYETAFDLLVEALNASNPSPQERVTTQ